MSEAPMTLRGVQVGTGPMTLGNRALLLQRMRDAFKEYGWDHVHLQDFTGRWGYSIPGARWAYREILNEIVEEQP